MAMKRNWCSLRERVVQSMIYKKIVALIFEKVSLYFLFIKRIISQFYVNFSKISIYIKWTFVLTNFLLLPYLILYGFLFFK